MIDLEKADRHRYHYVEKVTAWVV